MDGSKIGPAKGASALELLIIAAAIAVLAAFASTVVDYAKPKSELEQAITITESSIEHARQTARFFNTDVLMSLGAEDKQSRQSIILSMPDMQKDPSLNEVKKEFVLPPGIQIAGNDEVIHFESNGEIESPASVLVITHLAEHTSHQFVIK